MAGRLLAHGRLAGVRRYLFKSEVFFFFLAVCKIPVKLNDGVVLTDKFNNEGIIEFTCNHGYKLIGSHVLRCVSGEWNDTIPSCLEGNCLFLFAL